MNGNSGQKIIQIDSLTDLNKITTLFDNKYRNILDDINSQGHESQQNSIPRDDLQNFITIADLNIAINSLNIGIGWDQIHANSLKFSGAVFRNFLVKYFNKLLDHAFMPKDMIYGEIRPVIKSKTSSKNDSDNYRPVMSSSALLKIFEYILLPFLKNIYV